MKKYGVFAVLTILLCSLCIVPVSAEETDDEWKQYFFLSEDGLDLSLIYKYLDDLSDFTFDTPKTNWEVVQSDLQRYNENLNLNFKEAHIFYTGIWSIYDPIPERLNYDGTPAYFGERCIMIPAYTDNGLAVDLQILCQISSKDGLPSREEEVIGTVDEVYKDFRIQYYRLVPDIQKLRKKDYTGVKKAYEAVKSVGASIKKIMRSSYDGYYDSHGDGCCIEDFYIITVEEECGCYIYSVTKNQLYTVTEYMEAKRLEVDSFLAATSTTPPTPKPTPTPTPTPRLTPKRTPYQPTVTPRPSATEGTVRPTVPVKSDNPSGNAGISPTASPAAPETEKTGLTWIAPIAVLCCAAAGGIVWAAVTVKKKKDK